jgi:MoaA/NifB/PqqE/SkfB family radical SAM enzyme
MKASMASGPALSQLAATKVVRKKITREIEKTMMNWLTESRADPNLLPGVEDDRIAMGLAVMGSIERALAGRYLSDATIRAILQLLVKGLFFEQGDQTRARVFEEQFHHQAPSFLLISPSKACNLRCEGCYADSNEHPRALEWSIVDRLICEAKELWGARFFVFSGGEPFAYKSEGKGILELIEKHTDCFFMTYTNGTLITDEMSRRLADDGNMLLCISVEGWRERTDARRGEGVFDKVLATMNKLRQDGVPFGISLTGTRHNAEEILTDEFIDFFISKGAIFAWLFQYMPIGRAYTLDLMVTPQQRAWMWHRAWQIVREKRFFFADFWNSGTACGGCLSAGGHGKGGFFYVDWNGAVSPCVFTPYSPMNIRQVYATGRNLNDVWNEPFFHAVRTWQDEYEAAQRNGLAPCPNRDHHEELERLLQKYEPEPTDVNAAQTLVDPLYTSGLREYNREFESLTGEIWQKHYVEGVDGRAGRIAPLPEVPCENLKDSTLKVDQKVPAK